VNDKKKTLFVLVALALSAQAGCTCTPAPLIDTTGIAPPSSADANYVKNRAHLSNIDNRPGVIEDILYPTLGCPARLEPGKPIEVVLDKQWTKDMSLHLVPRLEVDRLLGSASAVAPISTQLRSFLRDVASLKEDSVLDSSETLRNILLRLEQSKNPLTKALTEALLHRGKYTKKIRDTVDLLAASVKRFLKEGDEASRKSLRNLAGVLKEGFEEALSSIRISEEILATFGEGSLRELKAKLRCLKESVGSVARDHANPGLKLQVLEYKGNKVKAIGREAVAPGLYALVLLRDGEALDVQINSVYRQRLPSSTELNCVVAADIQWGPNSEVVESTLHFIRRMNTRSHAEQEAPEFILLLGDVVDCRYSSRGSFWDLLGPRLDEVYAQDFLQAWFVLATLQVPIYIIPGNHDGYRFLSSGDCLLSDGLLLFQDTFGPLYYSFDRGQYRFIGLNSYDLPAEFRTARVTASSALHEKTSKKLNVLNWGGSMGRDQHVWLKQTLARRGGKLPMLFMHHDPRGSFPTLKSSSAWALKALWSYDRHFPLSGDSRSTRDNPGREVRRRLPPKDEDTTEIHAGFYTPLRTAESTVRGDDWFGTIEPPAARGYPGWARFQQGWHSKLQYSNGTSLEDPLLEINEKVDVESPEDLLQTIVEGEVRALFKGHDNRFCFTPLGPETSIFGSASELELLRHVRPHFIGDLGKLILKKALTVYHVADIADADSDGHGFLEFRISPDGKLTGTGKPH